METRALEAEGRISSSRTKEDALANAISAAECYMKAIKLANNSSERARLKEKGMNILARAEEIEKIEQWQPAISHTGAVITPSEISGMPQSRRQLSTREEVILLEGSKLHGLIFPPWRSEFDGQEFAASNGEVYTDPSKINISNTHADAPGDWRRPEDLLGDELQDASGIRVQPTMQAAADIDLVQDVTADCSVVASLCAAVARPGGTYGKLLERIFYPYDKAHGIPEMSKNGKYIFRLHFNGCFRKVVIDDRLPAPRNSRRLYVFDRQNPGLLWPALLEKAYLKVRGGYDFPGSNSGTDLWVITSWIPEQIFLQSDELQPNDLWSRILNAFALGDVMVTLGTGRLNNNEEEALGLAGEHDYAVLDIKEKGAEKLFLLKNPWCDAMVWKGAEDQKTSEADHEASGSGNAVPKASTNPGTFWMSYPEVMRNFDSLYLNWNPGLFTHRQDHHFNWAIPSASCPGCFIHNPQYSVHSSAGGTVWILLSRHFTTAEHNYRASSVLPSSTASASNSHGFISLYIFDSGGHRIHLSDNPLSRGPYVDSPQTLSKLLLPPNTPYTIVIAHQDLPLPKYTFTLSAYSASSLTLLPAPNAHPHITTTAGTWTSKTAGGNASSPTYASNPQFKLHLPTTPTYLSLVLAASPPDLAIHVKLVWGRGQRVTSVTSQDIVGESGSYRRGCALANLTNVAAGDYTIVCSTFESGQTGKFTLRIESTTECVVTPVENEDAGRLTLRLPPLYFHEGATRMLAPLSLARITRLRIVAQHACPAAQRGAISPLKVSVERGQGPNKSVLATSGGGGFSDAPAGVRVGDIDLTPGLAEPGGLWVVVERVGGGRGRRWRWWF
ncbi:cysteine protease [Pseudogymnoascus destructans]|uniref:Cysteine protease n=1 Tax=Pseudogymnoascus destructans TaxID=655981 RepID=A0A177A7I7_9PEZI|nr:cysteine protease [Pseudogymnoascus destructans]OAF58125.1 cysteine protease [Pseudogymnoascus destructans]